jgi:ParB/RepB/Spo0J family partition protein
MIELQTIPLSAIVESTFNPRKNFNAAKLAELTESVKASGVLQPILVRPLSGQRVADTERQVQFEIIAGARRFRASLDAGLKTVPAIVRTMDDETAMEAAILENLQRDDLTELEEAEGYDALMQHSGINADEVGAKIGKSRSYVYARLKLLDLSLECKQAMREGQIDASRALLIARIPDPTLQAKALTEATRKDWRGDTQSVRSLQAWLQTNVMLRLDRATFRITDSTLVKAAGSCKDCPKRTGANPDLFADVDGADICTDPVCFHGKEAAQRADMLATAEAKGMRLVEGAEAKEICHQYRNTLKGYSPLSQVRTDIAGEGEVKLGTVLGKDSPPAVLIENPWTKELIAAVPTEEAEAVLVARGLIKQVQQEQTTREDLEYELAQLKKATEQQIDRSSRNNMFTALVDGIRTLPDAEACKLLSPALLRAWFTWMVGEIDIDDQAFAFGIEVPDELNYDEQLTHLRLHVQACDSAKLYRALAIHMMQGDSTANHYFGKPIEEPTLFEPVASIVQIDLSAIKKNTAADVQYDMAENMKRIKAEIKALAKAEKAPLPTAPLAQPSPAGGVAKTKGQGKTTPAKKPKLSAEEAKAGIAAAMQSIDGAQTAAPEASNIEQEERAAARQMLGLGLPIGAKVTALFGRYKGKQGEVVKDCGDDIFSVKFKGVGSTMTFRPDQLELVQEVEA